VLDWRVFRSAGLHYRHNRGRGRFEYSSTGGENSLRRRLADARVDRLALDHFVAFIVTSRGGLQHKEGARNRVEAHRVNG